MAQRDRRRVVVIATGGTIASRSSDSGARAQDTGEQLLEQSGLEDSELDLESQDIAVTNSFNFDLGDLVAICSAVAHATSREDVHGVVVTHGTDTMEETLAILALTHRGETPVVLTGAQRSPDQADSDGPRNLRDAVRTAASDSARGRGVMLVFGGAIHAAWGTSKQQTLAMQPFEHRSGGVIGRMYGHAPYFFSTPEAPGQRQLQLPSEGFARLRVDCILSYPGADGALLKASLAAGAQGAVIAAHGAANPGKHLVHAIEHAVEAGMLIAVGSRASAGAVAPIYGGGGAVDAVAAGAHLLGDIPVTQARILLALLVDQGTVEQARAALDEWTTPFRDLT
ncbi:asparaginase [Nesterenkonia massiliensis]|uniref:asparaginase n=1 Tax=Nesterenkonia massiliensis TaxID=1232429 RepID=UPI0005C880A4|nr:asparaginase [Nesterenkonia massiliensis]